MRHATAKPTRLQDQVGHDEPRVAVRHIQLKLFADPGSNLAPPVEDGSLTARIERWREVSRSPITGGITSDRFSALPDAVGDVSERQNVLVDYPERDQTYGLYLQRCRGDRISQGLGFTIERGDGKTSLSTEDGVVTSGFEKPIQLDLGGLTIQHDLENVSSHGLIPSLVNAQAQSSRLVDHEYA